MTGVVAEISTTEAEIDPIPPSRARTEPTPQWRTVFHDALAHDPGGYAYCVMRNGVLVDSDAWGHARMPQDGGGVPFTIDTRCNLASVSKTVTATALFAMIQKGWVRSVNDPFWPYFGAHFPGLRPAEGVDGVTIAELLTMISRLPKDGALYAPNGLAPLIIHYLAGQAVIPDQLYSYSNTNFTILQTRMDAIGQRRHGGDYLQWVRTAILDPAGIDTSVFSAVPDSPTTATLSYNVADPTGRGKYWSQMQCVGPGGWIASASTLITFLAALRGTEVIEPTYTTFMMEHMLGWYPGATTYGLAYHHTGGLKSPDGTALSTGVVRFPHGYDAVLLTNKSAGRIIALMIEAFDATA
jgi:CubicO group peptidase (beta-lactamase class C family)